MASSPPAWVLSRPPCSQARTLNLLSKRTRLQQAALQRPPRGSGQSPVLLDRMCVGLVAGARGQTGCWQILRVAGLPGMTRLPDTLTSHTGLSQAQARGHLRTRQQRSPSRQLPGHRSECSPSPRQSRRVPWPEQRKLRLTTLSRHRVQAPHRAASSRAGQSTWRPSTAATNSLCRLAPTAPPRRRLRQPRRRLSEPLGSRACGNVCTGPT